MPSGSSVFARRLQCLLAFIPPNRISARIPMSVQLKKLKHQVMVITGASSGIGLATASMAPHKGAKLVLTSRNESALREVTREIREKGGEAIYVAADIADTEAVERVAEAAIREFGGFDPWVNNAGVA